MIDWKRVRELRDEIGEEDFSEVVDLFLEEVEEVGEPPGIGDVLEVEGEGVECGERGEEGGGVEEVRVRELKAEVAVCGGLGCDGFWL